MDFRLPKVPHAWGELAKEIAIIVVGVLIALFFEQLVQDWQWRQRVAIAEHAIRGELLGDDAPQAYQRVAMHPCIVERLNAIRSALESGDDRASIAKLVSGFQLQAVSYDSYAYQEAQSSQAFEHMTREDSRLLSQVYSVIPLMDRTSSQESADLGRLHAFRQTGGADAESIQLLEAVEGLRNDDAIMSNKAEWILPRVRQLGRINRSRIAYFLNGARNSFGNCVKLA
jgi:hypothetical protein